MTPPTPTPRLTWSVRPKRLACACGRTPLLGFLDAEMTEFWCAACVTDDTRPKHRAGGGNRPPDPAELRGTLERRTILGGIR